jgi:hypothetical protein
MSFQSMDPAVVTVIMLMGGLVILLIIRFFTGGLNEKPYSVFGDLSVALIISVVLGPVVTHYLAKARELEQRRWNARTAHLERLRPILLADAANLEDVAKRISDSGHIIAIHSQHRDKEMEEIWFRHILIRDIGAHFPEFSKTREELRTEIALQQSEMMDSIHRIASGLGPNEDRRIEVAYALVRRCIGKGDGIKLEIQPGGGYSYQSGTGGSQGSDGNPPPHLVEEARVFREYKPDRSFKSDCARLSKRTSPFIDRLLNLAREARSLAEVATLPGDCAYTRVD